ncbi:ABC transporter, ATP-binding protein [Deferribacter desulfuricans SSM1]|uniref:ABC transporter, ATP-binding protein n=1 Tax=Deferribacter desulfuricans (strain DSM 14783 / JCM 11476 / NBRC 101012 / SSM1) TaxID=639282 RepID=D3PB56_DEFDS|nr:ABC transporter transmembrane domain-containing protein [Deferribacter desulfuricans]BAI79829.1 ABC transporter, ATP-binding protein [Deferribacter desulfuricans SSM1]
MKLLKRVWLYFRPYKWHIFFSFVFSLFVAASNGASAYIIKPALDGIFINKEKEKLLLMPFVIVGIYLIKGIFRFLQNFLMRRTGQKVVQAIRNDLFDKIIMLPIRFFSESSTGVLMSRITNDVNMVQSSIPSFVTAIRETFSILGLAAVVLYQDPYLGSFALFVLPLVVLPLIKIGKKIKKYSRRGQEKMGDISSVLQESFSGIRVVKAFANEDKEKEKFKVHNEKLVRNEIKKIVYNEISSPMMELIGAIGLALVIYYGGLKVIEGVSTPGTFFSFIAAIAMMYDPFKRINSANNNIQSAIAAAERIFEIMDTENEILENDGELECDAKGKDVIFDHVYFRYKDNEDYVLKNINLSVKPGTTVAIVGSSGAGKSTLVSLIPRFYDVTSGAIKIGETDIRDFKVHSLRKNIGIVSQEPFLFNDTVFNNIAYSMNNVTEEDVINAAKAAYAHEFILELPEGYNTVIGERGVRLSGGQRQRITIARALLKNPPILILDEATSALDTESEKIVQKALENLMKHRTSFVIAHRLSTVINSDVIVVLDKGEIESIGTHKELLVKSKVYKKLYHMQFQNGE